MNDILEIQDLTIRFGGLVAVNNVQFSVKKGEIFGLIGPNGAGKTTIFNLISGVLSPTSGKIIFKENRIDGKKPYQINEMGISRTYQNINLFSSMTVLENVMVGCHSESQANFISSAFRLPSQRQEEREIYEKSMEILSWVGLENKANFQSSSLAYGEQRRLEIARALGSNPSLLLLDEPAAGMNTSEKAELNETILDINEKGVTILIVEHDMSVIMNISNRVCVINYGEKIALDVPEVVQQDPIVIEAYLGSDKDE